MRFVILLGLVALGACSPGHDKAPQASSADEGSPAPATGAAPPAPTEPSAPVDITMPDFAPQYPGSTIKAVNISPSGEETHEVTLTTQDDAARIADFYRERFMAAGLQKTSEFLSGGTGMMSAAGKNRRASIAIGKEATHNVIIVTYSGR